MNELVRIICAGMVVFATFTLEGISGFGSTVLALPFIIILLGIKNAVPFLSSLGLLMAIFIVIRSRRQIRFREFIFIALHVAPGVACGLFLMSVLPEKPMLILLVSFMYFVGIRGLVTNLRSGQQQTAPAADSKPPKTMLMRFILFCGGIIHGAFSSGGPFVVIYASRALPDKSLFRVTLSMLWLLTNSIMITKWTVAGDVWNIELGKTILYALPFITCGIVLGDYLHHKVNTFVFRIIVYSVLTAAATVLFICKVLGG